LLDKPPVIADKLLLKVASSGVAMILLLGLLRSHPCTCM